MTKLNCAVVGIAALLIMIGFANLTSASGVSEEGLSTAIVVLRRDLDVQHQNNMNVLNSLLQRIRKIEKQERIMVPRKYKVAVDGAPR